MIRVLVLADRALIGLATAAACLALAVALVAGTWQVVARFATETPAVWTEALVRSALIWMVFLGLATTLRAGALLSIDVVHRYAPRPVRAVLEAVALLANLMLLGVLFWFGWTMAQRVQFQVLAGLEISIAWAYAAIPIGAVFAMIGAVAHYFDRRSTELETAL